MMRSFYLTPALFLILVSISCAQKSRLVKNQKPTITQGICGTVVEKRGNYMPSVDSPGVDSPGVDSPRLNPGGTPVVREVLIFPLLNMGQVDMGDNGFINSVRGVKPLKTVKSNKEGRFCVSLPAGRYSVLVQEPQGLYANLSDSQGNINPVNVEKKRQSSVKIDITHQAVF